MLMRLAHLSDAEGMEQGCCVRCNPVRLLEIG